MFSFKHFEHPERPSSKPGDPLPAIHPSQSYMHSQQNPPIPLVARDPISHGIPVQHTDEAASEETQRLRRRCYNCHTTEPPSWRRSTLTPAKIACDQCGPYERTDLRPRPLRFDELRVRDESRKQGKVASPKPLPPGSITIMKGETEPISRSLSLSPGSSVEGRSSDWDDSGMFSSFLARFRACVDSHYSFSLFF